MKFKKSVNHIKFSNNGRYFSVCLGRHVQIWSTPSSRRDFSPFVIIHTFTGHTEDVTRCEWSKSDGYVMTSSGDNTARVYMINGEREYVVKTLAGHRERVVGGMWEEGENLAYTVSGDGAVFTWGYEGGGKGYGGEGFQLKTKHYLKQEGSKVTGERGGGGGETMR